MAVRARLLLPKPIKANPPAAQGHGRAALEAAAATERYEEFNTQLGEASKH